MTTVPIQKKARVHQLRSKPKPSIQASPSIHALARLVGRNKIHLSLTLFQNDLINLEVFTSGNSTVQLPEVDQRAIQNDSVLAPGEVLVLSGYEQERATRSNQGTGLARFLGFGGSAKGGTRKIRMVVLVRPAILPAVRGATVRKASRQVNGIVKLSTFCPMISMMNFAQLDNASPTPSIGCCNGPGAV